MSRPAKRLKLTSAAYENSHQQSLNRLKTSFEAIFDKYGRDFDGVSDEIDLDSGEVMVDNGHLANITDDTDIGPDPDVVRRRKAETDKMLENGNTDDALSSGPPEQTPSPGNGRQLVLYQEPDPPAQPLPIAPASSCGYAGWMANSSLPTMPDGQQPNIFDPKLVQSLIEANIKQMLNSGQLQGILPQSKWAPPPLSQDPFAQQDQEQARNSPPPLLQDEDHSPSESAQAGRNETTPSVWSDSRPGWTADKDQYLLQIIEEHEGEITFLDIANSFPQDGYMNVYYHYRKLKKRERPAGLDGSSPSSAPIHRVRTISSGHSDKDRRKRRNRASGVGSELARNEPSPLRQTETNRLSDGVGSDLTINEPSPLRQTETHRQLDGVSTDLTRNEPSPLRQTETNRLSDGVGSDLTRNEPSPLRQTETNRLLNDKESKTRLPRSSAGITNYNVEDAMRFQTTLRSPSVEEIGSFDPETVARPSSKVDSARQSESTGPDQSRNPVSNTTTPYMEVQSSSAEYDDAHVGEYLPDAHAPDSKEERTQELAQISENELLQLLNIPNHEVTGEREKSPSTSIGAQQARTSLLPQVVVPHASPDVNEPSSNHPNGEQKSESSNASAPADIEKSEAVRHPNQGYLKSPNNQWREFAVLAEAAKPDSQRPSESPDRSHERPMSQAQKNMDHAPVSSSNTPRSKSSENAEATRHVSKTPNENMSLPPEKVVSVPKLRPSKGLDHPNLQKSSVSRKKPSRNMNPLFQRASNSSPRSVAAGSPIRTPLTKSPEVGEDSSEDDLAL